MRRLSGSNGGCDRPRVAVQAICTQPGGRCALLDDGAGWRADAEISQQFGLEDAVAEMQGRAAEFGGKTRTFTPSHEHPFLIVIIDELAFLTAYQPERDLRKRAEAAIATLTSQGRSVGVCVFGALQDPRKEVINLRNLFPTRIALRLDESEQVDMVLGDGARDRGALADQISPLPDVGAGVGLCPAGNFSRPGTGPGRLRQRRGHHRHSHQLRTGVRKRRRDGRGGRVITRWLSGEDCPDCGGPLLETSTCPQRLTLECPGWGYRTTWTTTDPGDKETE